MAALRARGTRDRPRLLAGLIVACGLIWPSAPAAAQTASVSPPAEAEPGAEIEVPWTGPDAPGDFVALAQPGAAAASFVAYARTSRGSPARLALPDEEGRLEVRYIAAAGLQVLAAAPVELSRGGAAALTAPAEVAAGATIPVEVADAGAPADFVTIVPADAPPDRVGPYARLGGAPAAEIAAPERAGDYEIRQVAAADLSIRARAPIRVTAAVAETPTTGPGEADEADEAGEAGEAGDPDGTDIALVALVAVDAGARFRVAWRGPAGPDDAIALFAGGLRPGEPVARQPALGDAPAAFTAPDRPGDYLIGYVDGVSGKVLATRELEVRRGDPDG